MNSATEYKAQQRLASPKWRWLHSAWLLAVLLGVGFFSCVGFIYVAVRTRQKLWTRLAVGSSLLTTVFWTLVVMADGVDQSATIIDDLSVVAFLILWLGGSGLGFYLNPRYLRWRATQEPWYKSGSSAKVTAWPTGQHDPQAVTPPLAGWPQQADPAQQSVLGVSSDPYYAPEPPGAPSSPPRPFQAPPGVAPAARLHINQAQADDLARAGVDQNAARHIVNVRAQQQGFDSLEAFIQSTGLPPHVIARLQSSFDFTAAASAPRTQAPQGRRVLDI